LDFEIDGVGSSPTQQFDKIDVTNGNATLLGGTLRLNFGNPAAFTAFTGTPLSLLQTSIAVSLTASAFALELIGADADFGVVVRESGTDLVAAALEDEGAPTNTLQYLADAGADGDLTATITDGSGNISGSYGGNAIFGNVETIVGGDYFNDFTAYGTSNVRFTGGDGGNNFTGAAGADILEGGSGGDTLVGNDGNDLIIGGGGPDTLEGGAGDDILQISDTGFSKVDGGADQDTLVLYGYVDLSIAYGQLGTGPGQKDISNIERFDLSGSPYGYGSVTLDYDAVVALSPDINDLLEAALPAPLQGTGETLVIDGDGSVEGSDAVFLMPAAGTWADTTYDAFGTHSVFSYTGSGGGAVLALVAIDDDVDVFTSSY
ncbi:MAG: calcium-binding protein, partial [Pseudomonadota bacterium]